MTFSEHTHLLYEIYEVALTLMRYSHEDIIVHNIVVSQFK